MVNQTNQKHVLEWAVRSFGAIALNSDERAARLAEEAIEIAQCEGVPLDVIIKIAQRVYSRPAGEPWQEVGGTGIALLAYAENAGLSLDKCIEREWTRVLSKPPEWWTMKHAEKVAAGTANLSPTPVSETLVDESCCPRCDSEICICGLGSPASGGTVDV